MKQQKKKIKREKPESSRYNWAIRVFLFAVILSCVLSFLSQTSLSGAGMITSIIILFIFILGGIVMDIIGVAVTAADERPFHSMAVHQEKGAKEAIRLVRNASQVSSICNDVVGDICGIVSGTTVAVIVTHLHWMIDVKTIFLSVGLTALVSGFTIGGKALGKTYAIDQSTKVVLSVGKFLHLFHRRKKR